MDKTLNIRFLNSSFQPKRTKNSSPSIFVAVARDINSDFDREELGEELMDDDDFGCIDPPGPTTGMGGVTQDDLSSDYGVVSSKKLLALKNENEASYLEFLTHIDGFFVETSDGAVSEIPFENLLSRLQEGGSEMVVEVIEFEPG